MRAIKGWNLLQNFMKDTSMAMGQMGGAAKAAIGGTFRGDPVGAVSSWMTGASGVAGTYNKGFMNLAGDMRGLGRSRAAMGMPYIAPTALAARSRRHAMYGVGALGAYGAYKATGSIWDTGVGGAGFGMGYASGIAKHGGGARSIGRGVAGAMLASWIL